MTTLTKHAALAHYAVTHPDTRIVIASRSAVNIEQAITRTLDVLTDLVPDTITRVVRAHGRQRIALINGTAITAVHVGTGCERGIRADIVATTGTTDDMMTEATALMLMTSEHGELVTLD